MREYINFSTRLDESNYKILEAERICMEHVFCVPAKYMELEFNRSHKTRCIYFNGKPLLEASVIDRARLVGQLEGLLDAAEAEMLKLYPHPAPNDKEEL